MKTLLLLFAISAGMVAFAQAQVLIGPKVGLTASTIQLGVEEAAGIKIDNSPKIGYALGLAGSFAMGTTFSLAPELLFIQKGGKYTLSESESEEEDGITFSYTSREETAFTLNFLEMPLLLRASFGSSAVKGYVNAGPSIGYWLGGKQNYTVDYSFTFTDGNDTFTESFSDSGEGKFKFVDSYSNEDSDDAQILKDKANRLALGASVGGGVMLPLGGSKLLLDARYTHALTDLVDVTEEEEGIKKFRTSGFSISTIFLFGK